VIEREDGAEVEFARAVAREEPAAVARFERELLAKIPAALARMKLDAATLDEVTQRVRERLLVPAEGEREPRLVGYAGQGRLEGLVLVTASRIALDLMRSRAGAEAHDGGAIDALVEREDDPLMATMKARAKAGFRAAFARAIDGLDPRDRNVLKLHLLRGVTLDRLAEMYSVHRATVVRWLADARAKVLSATRKELASAVGQGELDETIALLESQLDASIERLFRTRG
jgi:RNA polymerase sigma-70 factor, ECF subfamily